MHNYKNMVLEYDSDEATKEQMDALEALDYIHVQVPCPLCFRKVVYPIYRDTAGALGHCMHCGMYYSHIRYSDEALKIYYSRFAPGFLVNKAILEVDKIRRPIQNNLDLDIIEQYKLGGKMLDIGSCAGDFLCRARDRGWDVIAQELSKDCQAVLAHLEIPVMTGFVYESEYTAKSLDVITLRHTLEHFPAVLFSLTMLREVLKDDGILYIVVPMWLGDEWCREGGHNLPQHISHFTGRTLTEMLTVAGFEVLQLDYVDSSSAITIEELRNKPMNIRVVARRRV